MSTTQNVSRRIRPFAAVAAAVALTLPLAACGKDVDPNLSSAKDEATSVAPAEESSAPASEQAAAESSAPASSSATAPAEDIAVIPGTDPAIAWNVCEGDTECEKGMVDLTNQVPELSLEKDDKDNNGVLDKIELRDARLRADAESAN